MHVMHRGLNANAGIHKQVCIAVTGEGSRFFSPTVNDVQTKGTFVEIRAMLHNLLAS